jgi:signal peptidase I
VSRRPRPLAGGRTRRSSLLTVLAVGVVLLLAVKWLVAEPFRVPSASMAPTLRPGDRVLVNKLAYRTGRPARGDLALVEVPRTGELLLKRVVGLPGDAVEIRDGTLFVNGRARREPFVDRRRVDGVYFGPVRVPRDDVFVLGDNRGDSVDSRQLGPLPQRGLVGRVEARIWPPGRISRPPG